jgi:Zn-finger nucleic acid-binding protein
MEAVVIGKTDLHECPKCEGIWADVDGLQKICQDREQQAAVLGMAAPLPGSGSVGFEENVRYLPCPVCRKLMNRVNFANCSHVIVDVCRGHGTWFDKDELRRIVEFIRAGGMEQSRVKEIEELEARRRAVAATPMPPDPGLSGTSFGSRGSNYDAWDLGISAAATFLKWVMK